MAVPTIGISMRPGDRCTFMTSLSTSATWSPGETVIVASPVPSEFASACTMYRCGWLLKLRMSPALTIPVTLAVHPLLLKDCVIELGDAAWAPLTSGLPVATPTG